MPPRIGAVIETLVELRHAFVRLCLRDARGLGSGSNTPGLRFLCRSLRAGFLCALGGLPICHSADTLAKRGEIIPCLSGRGQRYSDPPTFAATLPSSMPAPTSHSHHPRRVIGLACRVSLQAFIKGLCPLPQPQPPTQRQEAAKGLQWHFSHPPRYPLGTTQSKGTQRVYEGHHWPSSNGSKEQNAPWS